MDGQRDVLSTATVAHDVDSDVEDDVDDGRRVTLGVPGAWIDESDAAATDVYTNKAGGQPDWYGTELVEGVDRKRLCCGVCGRKMFLLVQVYAPVQTVAARTLYVFACNNGECGNRPGSFKVLRTEIAHSALSGSDGTADEQARPAVDVQAVLAELHSTSVSSSAASKLTPQQLVEQREHHERQKQASEQQKKKKVIEDNIETYNTLNNDWGMGSVWDDSSDSDADDASAGAASKDESKEQSDRIAALLAQRNASDQSSSRPKQNNSTSSGAGRGTSNIKKKKKKTKKQQPKQQSSSASAATNTANAFTSFYLVDQAEPAPKQNAEQAKAQKLYESYLARESNEEKQSSGSSNLSSSWNESYERTGHEEFTRFSQRVARQPEQCLRYDLHGQPLLAAPLRLQFASKAKASHKSRNSSGDGGVPTAVVPPCELCGSRRAFEIQLTPNLLNDMVYADESADADGMDWVTVLVFTCTHHGCGKGKYCDEFVVVQ
eukprot:TRINITY_DN66820_c1_g1_i1.p1 TRINITY_DN66820_c1_g1~~TRINITY_DN66820_c1_g1_i1.p1  ORF type:complete len:491 (+),score=224.87 TRINITY_DN66820_c1_g1_i1:50-1522(+)